MLVDVNPITRWDPARIPSKSVRISGHPLGLGEVPPQPLQAPIIMMLHLSYRLPETPGNFVQGMPLKEEQTQSLSLIFRHVLESFAEPLPTEMRLDRFIVKRNGGRSDFRRMHFSIE
jgi:hypothetical protein